MRKTFSLSRDIEMGISETIATVKNNIGQLRYEVVPLLRIKLDPTNPRKLAITRETLNQPILESDSDYLRKKQEMERLQSMAHSISKIGVRHAVEVYKDGSDYRLISGERRVLASLLAGKKDISVRILEQKPTALDLKFLQWVENIEREDLSTWEKIVNVQQLADAYMKQNGSKLSAISLGELLGCSRQAATTWLTGAEAPTDILEASKLGKVPNLEKLVFLARIKDPVARSKNLEACINNASLDEMKLLLEKKGAGVTKAVARLKRGRPVKKIALGYTENGVILKKIMDIVLASDECAPYKKEFDNINWNNFKDAGVAFKKFISYMEKVYN
ncbi:MAG: hypothetical protein A2X78_01450 [Gammaproteobacteria bacterium GWE2_37_16]|nr:MAG: hypothetical protein A2X78_01450 [Gammaproteobacteria bacterium GWE2_37_16]